MGETIRIIFPYNRTHQLFLFSFFCLVGKFIRKKKKFSTTTTTQFNPIESNEIFINWGERANAEITKRSVLEFVCRIGYKDSVEPKNFVSHYAKVTEEEDVTE